MSDQSDLGLGRLVRSEHATTRDAIHIAVVPVIVNDTMAPGTKVRLMPSDKPREVEMVEAADERPYVGVIDPYLQRDAQFGERVWLFLNPGSIRSLRHTWGHPAFDKEQA